MQSSFRYEVGKMKKVFKNLFLWILIVQILSLIFFTIVGKFEVDDMDDILQNGKGIITLSITITLSVVTIYAVMLINRVIIKRYIGNFRERTYTYATGRDQMFRAKIYAFIYKYMIVFVIYTLLINTVFYLFCIITSFIKFTTPVYVFLPNIVLLSVLVSITIILISGICGIYYQSTNICLITSIILIALIGNLVANTYDLDALFVLIINVGLCVINFSLIKFLEHHIRVDDLLHK